MKVKQLRVGMMATFCYIVGDESSRTCAVIDPAFETRRILNKTRELGFQVIAVINTHAHFDHSGGNGHIIAATGARLYIHELEARQLTGVLARTSARFLGGKGSPSPDVLLKEGDTITIGETSLEVIHTPGHTRGGICLYTVGHVFTGDTLFVQGVGRTDLAGGSWPILLKSIQEKLYTLPGDTIVWPGHDYGPTPYSTIAREQKSNFGTL